MWTLLMNLMVLAIIASPLLAIEGLRSKSRWVEEHHDRLSIVAWLAILVVVYVWVLPYWDLEQNPEFFRDQYDSSD